MKRLLVILILLTCAASIRLVPLCISSLNKDTIHVTVSGAVKKEGEYEIPLYSSMDDLLDMCGTKDNADLNVINRAAVLKDHDAVVIPEIKAENEPERISINTASADQLCTLKGIGPATAEAIIAYRNENGLFQSIEDIMRVKGIGEATFEKIRDSICL